MLAAPADPPKPAEFVEPPDPAEPTVPAEPELPAAPVVPPKPLPPPVEATAPAWPPVPPWAPPAVLVPDIPPLPDGSSVGLDEQATATSPNARTATHDGARASPNSIRRDFRRDLRGVRMSESHCRERARFADVFAGLTEPRSGTEGRSTDGSATELPLPRWAYPFSNQHGAGTGQSVLECR